MRESGRWTARRIVLRRLGSRPGASVFVVVLALIAVFVATAAPRLVEAQAKAELSYQLGSIGAPARSLQGTAPFPENWPPGSAPDLAIIYGGLQDSIAGTPAGYPQPLRHQVGAPQWIVQTPTLQATRLNGAAALLGIQLTADRSYRSKIRLTEGRLPGAWNADDVAGAKATRAKPVEIALSVTAAKQLGLGVGDVLGTDVKGATASDPTSGVPDRLYRISGVFEPADPRAAYWKQNPALLPVTTTQANSLVAYPNFSAFVDPLTVGRLSQTFFSAQLHVYYPVAATGIEGTDAALLRSQLARASTSGVALPDGDSPLALTTGSLKAIDTATERVTLLGGLLGFIAGAPIGVLLAVLVLGVQVVVRGRRGDLLLASSRGASPTQLRGTMALESALLIVPPGVVVIAVVGLLIPARLTIGSVLPPLVALAAVPVLFAVLTPTSPIDTAGGRLLSQFRWVVEAAVVLLAGLSLFLLARRGLAEASGAVGFDPLLTLVPLFVALAVGILVLRVFPLLMAAAGRIAVRSRGLPSFVGALRAARAPTVGLAGVLALVVGISVSLFSAILLQTFDAGLARAAHEIVGADARVESARISPEQRRAVVGVAGVHDVAGVQNLSSLSVSGVSGVDGVSTLLAETKPLAALDPLPRSMATQSGGRIPVVVSSDLRALLGVGTDFVVGGVDVTVVGSLPAESGLGPTEHWVIIDSTFAPRFTTRFEPGVLLIKADRGRAASLLDPLRRAVGTDSLNSGTTVTTLDQITRFRGDEPVIRGIRLGLTAGAALSILMCVLGVGLSTVAAGATRSRLAGLLRMLGMPRRQLGALIAWELLPVAIVALLAGTALGVALSFVVTTTLDLRAFIGSATRVVPEIDPALLGGLLGVFALVVLAATIGAIMVGNRVNPSATITMGDS